MAGDDSRAEGEAYARRLEAVVAGHRGEATVAERLLDDDDPGVRAAALGALARCGALQAEQVRRALGDEAVAVRCRAAELAPPEVEFVALLSDPDASVVQVAAAALGERDRDPGSVEDLCRVAGGHDDPLCRESAVAALGAIAAGLDAEAGAPQEAAADPVAGPGATPTATASKQAEPGAAHVAARGMALEMLLAAMDDRPQIRRRALLGLYQFDDDRAADAVRAALEDRDRQVRAIAGELLGVPVR
ncbi:HEAT repeat domain-containing protein [Candidatus Poriferisodalis sp.]|uniref:HEAT repeat domain-containing protein n=1 Tax=Candidatus Poriferisodalis sp. TaxID=3101277 RepID=UPI003B5A6172